MSSPELYLMKGPMPEISKMKLKDLKEECKMWRNVWGWVPPEVKYYVSRIGQEVGLTMRNYKRYLGTLVDSHWNLVSLEVGTIDKVYDAVQDKTFYEKKIVVISVSGIVDYQFIKERKAWEDFEAERIAEQEKEEAKSSIKDDMQDTETEDKKAHEIEDKPL
jgi:hypothetical protein